ncbi:hypothetical protein B0H13DRAFT_1905278 [Mycena leptocephala]|nr:hypothetical protein B0H13DRAFT_1905278 [Mycena leptocephala]
MHGFAMILALNRRFLLESPPSGHSSASRIRQGWPCGQQGVWPGTEENVPKDGMDKSAPFCTPTTFSYGKNLTLHDNEATSQYWAVCKGHIPGIYLDHTTADHQIHGFRNNLWRAFDTHAEALAFWRIFCHDEHDHSAREYKVRGVVGTFKTYDDALDAAATAYIVAA